MSEKEKELSSSSEDNKKKYLSRLLKRRKSAKTSDDNTSTADTVEASSISTRPPTLHSHDSISDVTEEPAEAEEAKQTDKTTNELPTQDEPPKEKRGAFGMWLVLIVLVAGIGTLLILLVMTPGIRVDSDDTSVHISAQMIARNNAAWCAHQQNELFQNNAEDFKNMEQLYTHIEKRLGVFGPEMKDLSENTKDEVITKIPEPEKQKDLASALGFCALQMKADAKSVNDPELKKLLYSGSLGTYLDYEAILQPKDAETKSYQPLSQTMGRFSINPAIDYVYNLERKEFVPSKNAAIEATYTSDNEQANTRTNDLETLIYQLDRARYSFSVAGAQNVLSEDILPPEDSVNILDSLESVVQGFALIANKDTREVTYPLLMPLAEHTKDKGLMLASLDSSIEIYNHLTPYSDQVPDIDLWEESLSLLHYRQLIDSAPLEPFPGLHNVEDARIDTSATNPSQK